MKILRIDQKLNLEVGSTNWTLILFIIVIAFAFLLAGGNILFRGQAPSSDYSDEMVPLTTFAGTPITTHLWSLSLSPKLTCTTTEATFTVDAIGPIVGYIMLELALTNGGYETRVTRPFIETTGTTYKLTLPSVVPPPTTIGYAKSSWRLKLFEGGKKNGFFYTGGIPRVTIVNNPTSCPPTP